METVSVTIIEPRIKRLLRDLESLNLIELNETREPKQPRRRFGSMKGLIVHMSDDFGEPIDHPKD
jgi:hypothetical protein